MATDIKKLLGNLFAFYDFSGKTVVSVGAGGGQLVEYARPAGRVFAVDNCREALEKLGQCLAGSDLAGKFTLVHSDFLEFSQAADVVMFEFSLHEIADPGAALEHARRLAGEVLVLEHWPRSEWAYYVAEEEKVAGSWQALRRFPLRRTQSYEASQFFHDHEELQRKVQAMGQVAIDRIAPFRGREDFSIPFSYGFALM